MMALFFLHLRDGYGCKPDIEINAVHADEAFVYMERLYCIKGGISRSCGEMSVVLPSHISAYDMKLNMRSFSQFIGTINAVGYNGNFFRDEKGC